jgi:hypothetical protein
MTAMMSTILRELSLISPMVCTTCDTTVPPRLATEEADCTRSLACLALSVFWRTVEVNSSIEDAVCCKLEAWLSILADTSALPLAMSWVAALILSTLSRTSLTMWRRLSFISFRARNNWPTSFSGPTSKSLTRLPLATAWATEMALFKGAVTERVISTAI